ncbi:MAG TPA: anthranilate phosphoribosyltransferase [Micropepsaceae bacterium]|jgi:anthranilate phosphoribosyltransferase|nr:anthranilate phosphoribosyltransferase [Micropepsaceae bacterium]
MSKPEGEFATLLRRVAAGEHLSAAESASAFGAMMAGAVSDIRMAGFLTAMAVRSPGVAEITGAARAMREAMTEVQAPPGTIDVCGTGGDNAGTLNVSTAAAFVVAGCGVPVAKHGNRAMSSRTGAADVLEALGVPIDHDAAAAKRHLANSGFAFLFAPAYHPAMKNVGQVRKELGFRTMFNLLGPICNPARVRRQLMGIFAEEWLEPVAHVLADLGTEKAWVVHGTDGLDEMTTTGVTRVAVMDRGHVSLQDIAPEDAGLKRGSLAALKGGTAEDNARAIRDLLSGAKNAFRDIVVLNAGAALVVADKAKAIAEGVALAAESIDKGHAARAYEQSRTSERARA